MEGKQLGHGYKWSVILLICVLTLCPHVHGAFIPVSGNTDADIIGVKETMNQRCFNEIVAVGVPLVLKEVKSISVPAISGSADVPVVGRIDYELSEITVSDVTLANANLTAVAAGLQVSCGDLGAKANLHWHYREHSFPHLSDSGTADVDISDASIVIDLALSASEKGELVLKVTGSHVDIHGFSIHLHGGASWLYQFFEDLFNSQIKSAVQSALEDEFKTVISQQVDTLLASLPVVENIDSHVQFVYRLVGDPVVDPAQRLLTTGHLGEFYNRKTPGPSPGSPASLPNTAVDKMMQVFLSEWTLNSLAYAYFTSGVMSFTLSASQLPAKDQHFLNTSDYKILIPGLYEACPNCLMELDGSSTDAPACSITAAGVEGKGVLGVSVMMISSNGSKTEAFTLLVSGVADMTIALHQQNITGHVSALNVSLSLKDTHVGPIATTVLQSVVTFMVQNILMPFLNDVGAKGFQFPSLQGLSFVDPEIVYGAGYVMVATDWKYQPSSSG